MGDMPLGGAPPLTGTRAVFGVGAGEVPPAVGVGVGVMPIAALIPVGVKPPVACPDPGVCCMPAMVGTKRVDNGSKFAEWRQ